MPKEEWGVKRMCPTTGRPFYDLNKTPIISPYTGDEVKIDTGNKSRVMVADKADAASKPKEDLVEDAEVVLEEDVDVDLGNDVLDDDDDSDDLPLEEIADVAAPDDEN